MSRARRTVVCLLLVTCVLGCERAAEHASPAGEFGIHPDHYGVPEGLRELVPVARRWGVADDRRRLERIESASHVDIQVLRAQLDGRLPEIEAWLDRFDPDDPGHPEAEAFLYLLAAAEELGI